MYWICRYLLDVFLCIISIGNIPGLFNHLFIITGLNAEKKNDLFFSEQLSYVKILCFNMDETIFIFLPLCAYLMISFCIYRYIYS